MTIRGTPRNYHKKFAFVVECEGITYAGFESSSELEAEIAKIEQHEGGALIPDKSPGRVKMTDITLRRGASQDDDLWKWWKQVVNVSANSGLTNGEYKRDLEIVQLDRDGSVLRRWAVFGAWPTKFGAGSWDNNADENVIESLVLTFDLFDPLPAAGDAG